MHEFATIDLYKKGLLLGDITYCNVCRRSILNALGGLQCVGMVQMVSNLFSEEADFQKFVVTWHIWNVKTELIPIALSHFYHKSKYNLVLAIPLF